MEFSSQILLKKSLSISIVLPLNYCNTSSQSTLQSLFYLFPQILQCLFNYKQYSQLFIGLFVMLWFIVLRQEMHYQKNRNMIICFFDQLQKRNIKFRIVKEKHPSIQQNDQNDCKQMNQHSVIHLPCHQEHYFHAECCRQWLGRDPRSPLCRHGLESPKDVALLEFT